MRSMTIRSFFVAFIILTSTTNCGTSSSLLSSGSALMSALAKNVDLSMFKNLLSTPGLDKLLGDVLKGGFTLLAPTNKALNDLGTEMLGKLTNPANATDVANVVKNHIIHAKIDAATLQKGGLKTAGGKALDLSGVNLGTAISDSKFNIFPVDKVLK
jgi:uncharacterized surface protein with fasciclin (FAS1) repeats